MDPGTVRGLLEQAGLQVLEVGWLDVVWWPDILDPAAWLAAMLPSLGKLLRDARHDGYRWEAENLPYFDPMAYADLHRRMHRLGWMERSWPALLQVLFAHHFAVLAVKENTDA